MITSPKRQPIPSKFSRIQVVKSFLLYSCQDRITSLAFHRIMPCPCYTLPIALQINHYPSPLVNDFCSQAVPNDTSTVVDSLTLLPHFHLLDNKLAPVVRLPCRIPLILGCPEVRFGCRNSVNPWLPIISVQKPAVGSSNS